MRQLFKPKIRVAVYIAAHRTDKAFPAALVESQLRRKIGGRFSRGGAAQFFHIVTIGHRCSHRYVAACHNLGQKYSLSRQLHLFLHLAQKPTAGVLLDDGHTFQQHLVADIFQLIRLSAGHESQSADYRGRGSF